MLIEPLKPGEVPDELKRYAATTSTNMVIHGLGRRPETLAAWLDFYWALTRVDGSLPVEMKELIRQQIASLYECGLCTSFLVPSTEGREIDLDKAQCVLEPDERFSPAEQAMLEFTRKIFAGPEAVDEATFTAVRKHFTEEQITEMGFVAAMLTGWGRLTFGFQVVNDVEADAYAVE